MELAQINHNLDALAAHWVKAPDLMQDEFELATIEIGLYLEAELGINSPRGANDFLSKSHEFIGPITDGADVSGVVGTSLSYAVPIELGTKPHMPPITPLIDWVSKVIDPDPDDVEPIAQAIAHNIRVKGTEGQFVYKRTFADAQPMMADASATALANVVRRLGDAQ